jgi:membrane fusion protein (multidrug efflux system)
MIDSRCTVLLAGALMFLGACSKPDDSPKGKKDSAVAVETELVHARMLEREVVAVGSLRSDESVVLSPEIAGRIAGIAFDEGQTVQSGALIVSLDDSIPRAELEQARASLALAKRNAERAGELGSRGLISQSERDQTAAQLQLDQARYELAQAQLAKTRITAPFAGRLGLRQVSPGDYVTPGQALVALESSGRMKIEFRVPELALSSLREGQTVDIELDSYPGEIFAGEVYAIDTRVADDTRSVALRARLENREGRLRPGMFARVKLIVERKPDALMVSEQSIFPRGEHSYVYVVDQGKAELREVQVGTRKAGSAEIRSGLRAGERLVTAGHQNLNPGATVQMAATPGGSGQPAAGK